MSTQDDRAWAEYDAAAEWCAARGLKGEIGDPLPPIMSADAIYLIQNHEEEFQERVRACAYARAMNATHDRYGDEERDQRATGPDRSQEARGAELDSRAEGYNP